MLEREADRRIPDQDWENDSVSVQGLQRTGGIALILWMDMSGLGAERDIGCGSSLSGSRVCLVVERAALAGITGCVQWSEIGCRVLGV